MQNMSEREFVSMVINDKKYMVEVFGHIPDEVVEKQAQKGKEQQAGEEADLGPEMAGFLVPAAEAMGLDFDSAVLAEEAERQIKELSGFGKMKFLMRFATSLKKAGKSGKSGRR